MRLRRSYPVCSALAIGCVALACLCGCGMDGDGGGVVRVLASTQGVCAETTDGQLFCWGYENVEPDLPSQLSLEGVVDIAVSDRGLCLLMEEGVVDCRGAEGLDWGLFGAASEVERIALSSEGACLVARGELACSGLDPRLAETPTVSTIRALDMDDRAGCALDGSGEIHCWGADNADRLLSPAGSFRTISVRRGGCALAEDGAARCWGRGQIESVGPYSEVGAGFSFGCGLRTSDGGVECWSGFDDEREPKGLVGSYTQLSVGGDFVCAVTSQGLVECSVGGDRDDAERIEGVPAELAE